MSKSTAKALDVQASACDVFAYYAIPIEAFQSIVDEQTVSGSASLTDNLVIGSLAPEEFLTVDNSMKYCNTIRLQSQSDVKYESELKVEEESCKTDSSDDLKCLICKTTFAKLTQYRKHVLEHRNAKKFKCEQCNASYNMADNFKLHMAIHSKGPPCCPLCDRKFQRMASLKAHLIVHQVDETIACIKCMTEFEKEEDLEAHMEMHEREEMGGDGGGGGVNHKDLPLICSYCNYTFDDSKAYREHVSDHVKIKKMVLGKRKKRTNIPKEHAHKCNVCQKSFPKLSLLERHLRIHSGEKPFICSYCNKGFAQNGTLQIHLSRHKGLKPFSCTLCPAKFNQKGNLRVHIQKTHLAPETGEKVYRCTMCTCVFKRVASLNAHITKAHANASKESEETDEISKVMEQLNKLEKRTNAASAEPEKVDVDGAVAVQQQEKCPEGGDAGDKGGDEGEVSSGDATYVKLADSSVDGVIRRYLVKQIKVGDSRFYVCWYCGRQFKKPSDLIRHIRIHTREKPFKCKQCNQSFSLKSTLVSHYNTHVGRRDYKCVICLKMFSSVRSLNTHIKKHYNKNQEPPQQYKCSMCNKTFNTPTKAKAHAATHNRNNTRETEVKEDIVMKQPMLETANGLLAIAAPKSKFPSVELEEYKNRPFRCHNCTAAFNKPVHLRRHLLRHSGDRRFKCDRCPKAFYNAYSLKEHKRFHSGVKNFTCRLCNKKFVTGTILKRHYATHSSYRPYICPYCKKRFTTVLLCRKHIKVHKKELLKSTETEAQQQTSKLLADVEIENVAPPVDNTYKPDSVIVSIATDGGVAKKVMELPLETTATTADLVNSTSLLQDNVNSLLNPQFYQLPLDVAQEFGVNEPVLETAVSDPVNNQVSLYINYDDLQTLNANIYGQLLSQTPQIKLQSDSVLLNELPDANAVFSLDNFAETQGFQENFSETVDLNLLLNKQVAALTTDITESSITLPNAFESSVKSADGTEKKAVEKTVMATDLNLQMDLTNSGLTPIFSALNSNLCETANVVCVRCTATTSLKDLESHHCTQKLPAVTIEKVEKPIKEGKPTSSGNSTVCVHCNKTFRNRKTYLKHAALHKNKKLATSHSCMYCQKIFKKPSDLKRHLRTHTGEKPFSCAKCPKSFSLKSTLEAHLRTHNPQGNKDFTCAVCNSCFSSKSSLKVHTALHTDIKAHACSFCEAKFRTAGHKKSHEQTHNKKGVNKGAKIGNLLGPVVMDATVLGDKVMGEGAARDEIIFVQNPVTEEQTNMQTDSIVNDSLNVLNQTIQIDAGLLQQLQNHGLLLQDPLESDVILSETLQLDPAFGVKLPGVATVATEEETQFQCDICGKNYSTKAILKKHRKIHGDGVEFRCSLCSKGFKNTAELERHNKIHLGQRPYNCHLCSNTFSEEGSMKTHMKRIHKINNVADMLLHYVEQDNDFIY